MNTESRCPRCHEGVMRTWEELSDEEQEVVKRLPAAADYAVAERQRTHLWCTRCWHESAGENERWA